MKKPASAIIVSLVLLTACKAALQYQDTQALAAELLQADVDFAALSQQTNPKQAFAAYMAPDAIMLPRAGEPLNGYGNAIASFGEQPTFELLWQPQLAEVAKSNDLGWTWGTYQVLVDGRQVSKGKYVNIWVRQDSGAWKVRLDIGNLDPTKDDSG